jgi:hypothetical protein
MLTLTIWIALGVAANFTTMLLVAAWRRLTRAHDARHPLGVRAAEPLRLWRRRRTLLVVIISLRVAEPDRELLEGDPDHASIGADAPGLQFSAR